MKTSESRYCGCVYFSANALARKLEKLATESWKKAGISPSHAYLLMAAIEEPGIQPGVLSDELQLTPSTITRLIEKLEAKKLVARTTDGKITNVYPTPKAKALLPTLRQCLDHFYKKFLSVAGREESSGLIRSMNKLADKLE